MNTIFKVDGKPFFPLGGQSSNSASYAKEELKVFFEALKDMNGNTGEVPIYWERLEPVEGQFDFTIVDNVILMAREYKVKLILLWFGSWKNGLMSYVPGWVKTDKNRFKRVISHDGHVVNVLSSSCEENLNADRKAFCAMMEHILKVDSSEKTVISVQVQNEAGIIGRSIRDHGPEAEKEFNSPVPNEITAKLPNAKTSIVGDIWRIAGAKKEGSWSELFGKDASELFNTWSLAKYIDAIAEAGKNVYNLPMYTNVWLDRKRWSKPGVDYPSGGPIPKVLDIWMWTVHALNLIAPDIYEAVSHDFRFYCNAYKRDDNPLFVPESDGRRGLNNDIYMFYALGQYQAIGYFAFGIEHSILPDGTRNQQLIEIYESFRAASSVIPLLIKLNGSGNVHSVVQEPYMEWQLIHADQYDILVDFSIIRADTIHHSPHYTKQRGRGLILQAGPSEFYVLGGGFSTAFRPKNHTVDYADHDPANYRNYLCVEEGRFDENDNWICSRVRSGDESQNGIWVHTDVGAVKVIIAD